MTVMHEQMIYRSLPGNSRMSENSKVRGAQL
jgi:hypothetical protein